MGSTHRSHYSPDQRHIALGLLLSKSNGYIKIPHGSIKDISKSTGIYRNSLRTIWRLKLKGERIGIRRSEGYKKWKHKTKDVINDKLIIISILKRGTIKSLRKQLNIGVGSVHREVKDCSIRKVVNYLKHTLNEKQK